MWKGCVLAGEMRWWYEMVVNAVEEID
jgi:hypothetical protein